VIVGGGIGGLSSAFDAKKLIIDKGEDKDEDKNEIVVVSDRSRFSFTPSNPWVSIGKRSPDDVQLDLHRVLPRHGIEFVHGAVQRLDPVRKELHVATIGGDGATTALGYDYLIIATGPKLAFDDIPGLRDNGYSVCTTPHATAAYAALQELYDRPGPCVVGAVQGASCFGPAYEYALLLQHALRKRGGQALVDACPVTFVTSEPEIGHLGLDGAGDSKHLLTDLLERHNMKYYDNTRVVQVTKDSVKVEAANYIEGENEGKEDEALEERTLPSRLTMLIPPFRGHDIWLNVDGLTDGKGMIVVDEHQQNPTYPAIFGVGVCVSMPNSDMAALPIPIGMPKTGYLIESQGTIAACEFLSRLRALVSSDGISSRLQSAFSFASFFAKGTTAVKNIQSLMNASKMHTKATLNAVCITDFGDDGAVFVALPQMPPRRFDYTIHNKAVTLAKATFEKYFLHKIETGDTDPYYEKYLLKLIGVDRTVEEEVGE